HLCPAIPAQTRDATEPGVPGRWLIRDPELRQNLGNCSDPLELQPKKLTRVQSGRECGRVPLEPGLPRFDAVGTFNDRLEVAQLLVHSPSRTRPPRSA